VGEVQSKLLQPRVQTDTVRGSGVSLRVPSATEVIRLSLADKSINNSCTESIPWPGRRQCHLGSLASGWGQVTTARRCCSGHGTVYQQKSWLIPSASEHKQHLPTRAFVEVVTRKESSSSSAEWLWQKLKFGSFLLIIAIVSSFTYCVH